jgi:hypothetical protein
VSWGLTITGAISALGRGGGGEASKGSDGVDGGLHVGRVWEVLNKLEEIDEY